jgi:hypothetical protein
VGQCYERRTELIESMITKDAIKAHHINLANVIFWFLSWNKTKLILKASNKDLLGKIMVSLGDWYEEDLVEAKGKLVPRPKDREISYLYPKFVKAVKDKAEEVKEVAGYKHVKTLQGQTMHNKCQ